MRISLQFTLLRPLGLLRPCVSLAALESEPRPHRRDRSRHRRADRRHLRRLPVQGRRQGPEADQVTAAPASAVGQDGLERRERERRGRGRGGRDPGIGGGGEEEAEGGGGEEEEEEAAAAAEAESEGEGAGRADLAGCGARASLLLNGRPAADAGSDSGADGPAAVLQLPPRVNTTKTFWPDCQSKNLIWCCCHKTFRN